MLNRVFDTKGRRNGTVDEFPSIIHNETFEWSTADGVDSRPDGNLAGQAENRTLQKQNQLTLNLSTFHLKHRMNECRRASGLHVSITCREVSLIPIQVIEDEDDSSAKRPRCCGDRSPQTYPPRLQHDHSSPAAAQKVDSALLCCHSVMLGGTQLARI